MDIGLVLVILAAVVCGSTWLLTLPNQGQEYLLNGMVNQVGFQSLKCSLYTNAAYTWSASSVLTDFSKASFPGYADTAPTFSTATIVAGIANIETAASQNFTCTGGGSSETCYGYYVWDATANKLFYGEPFTAGIVMVNNGDEIEITLNFSEASQ